MQAGANLYEVVKPWIDAAVSAASGIVHRIPEVAVSIAGWAIRTGANLYDVVQPWIESAIGAVSGIVHSIPQVLIDIGEWAQSGWEDLTSWVKSEVALAWTGNADDPVPLGAVSIKIGTFDTTVDFSALYASANDAFMVQTAVTDADLGNARTSGEGVGKKIQELFSQGITGVLSGDGGGDGTGGGALSGAAGLSAQAQAWIQGVVSGMFDGIDVSGIMGGKLQGLSDDLGAELQSWADGLADLLLIDIPEPDITWPDLSFSLSDVPFVTDFVILLGNISELFRNIDWSFEISMPDIDWPDVSSLVPKEIQDFLADPWGYAQSQFGGSGDEDPQGVIGGPAGGGGGRSFRSLDPASFLPLDEIRAAVAAEDFAIPITADNSAAMRAIGDVSAGLFGLSAMAAAVTITADNSAAMLAIGNVTAGLAGLALIAASVVITADNAAAMLAIGNVSAGLAGMAAMISTVVITGDNAAAMQSIGDVSAGMAGIDGMSSLIVLLGDNAAAMQSIGDVSAGMAGIDGMSSLIVLLGDNSAAMQSIGDVSAGMFGIDGMTSTIYVKGDNSGAMNAINAVAAYNGRSLGSATFTVRTVSVGSPTRVGAGMGAGMLRGWDRATGTRSPSTEMVKRGRYLYQGLDIGWTGSSSDLPIGFDVAKPSVAPAYAPINRAGGGGSTVVQFHNETNVTVEGNVTAEDDLRLSIVRDVNTGIANATQELKRSLGAS